jgi:dipeptidyl aminopeptidase/acylaminoacyl peptidase
MSSSRRIASLARRAGTLAALLAAPATLAAQAPATRGAAASSASTTFEFTIPNIMRGPEVYGREPQQVRWSADGKWIYFRWLPPGTDWRETPKPYRVRAVAGATPERVSDTQADSAGPLVADGDLSRDGRWRVVSYDGDLYLVDRRVGTARHLTNTPTIAETAPRFSADGKRVYFVREGSNVMALDLDAPTISQLTDIRPGPAPKDSAAPTGQRARLEEQQRELLEVVRDRLRADSIEKAEKKAREGRTTRTLYLLPNERVTALSVAPDGSALLLTTTIAVPGKAQQARIPEYVTASGYTEELTVRTKVGDAQNGGRVAYMTLPSGELHWLHPIPGDTARAPSLVAVLGWSDDGKHALLFSEQRDYKARYIHRVDGGGALATIDVLRDSAWVGGPCFPCGGWLPGGNRVWFVSEADGFAHLYTTDRDGGARLQLTTGPWEVLDARVSDDRKWFELQTSEVSPFEQHFYRMPIAGGARVRYTTRKGGHDVVVSPDGSMLADVYSASNRPPELFVMRATPGATMAQLTTSPTKEWLSFPWIAPEIVRIPASDGAQVPARIYRPSDMGAKPNGAAVIFVHGAGYMHNVHEWWSSYSREYMFNQYLASKGYVVLDLDYRASAGYGRDWRTAIYRWMGGRDLQDQVDASRWLEARMQIPPDRVGIYGGSYGGFITLMALFTEPKHFGAGAALRSVTDWAHYNHGYTARILNQPQDDTLAYRRSSPIYFAEGLEDPLLMAHGMVDTNVHFQDIVRLTERLIELGKSGWTLAPYPVENQGFVRPSSWSDEYGRIFELFERHLPVRDAAAGTGSRE